MRIIFCCAAFAACMQSSDGTLLSSTYTPTDSFTRPSFEKNSWPHFLQHLTITKGTVVDYKGKAVDHQWKQAGILNYDVGNRNLQQCADALMRLRAEYLFEQKRYAEIGFHFTSGHYFSFTDYCKGKRPVVKNDQLNFRQYNSSAHTHQALRSYLDIVYTYAGTISLYKELKPATDFAVGVVIITPGSPGHCSIIIDEKTTAAGKKLFKLVEGYSPAQTMYMLSNPYQPSQSPWYELNKDRIVTASYGFTNFVLRKFE